MSVPPPRTRFAERHALISCANPILIQWALLGSLPLSVSTLYLIPPSLHFRITQMKAAALAQALSAHRAVYVEGAFH